MKRNKSIEKAIKKIESIFEEQGVYQITIQRKYLPEIFSTELLEISKNDGLPTIKSNVVENFKIMGIIIEFSVNEVQFKIMDERLKYLIKFKDEQIRRFENILLIKDEQIKTLEKSLKTKLSSSALDKKLLKNLKEKNKTITQLLKEIKILNEELAKANEKTKILALENEKLRKTQTGSNLKS